MKMIAIEMGFYNGSRVRPGSTFEFTGKVAPKWARPADAPGKPASEPKLGDTKPADARAAVKAKTGAASEQSLV